MQIIDLFSGIGGFSLAGHWLGWHTVQFCEIDKFCGKVLAKNFPNVPIHTDIHTLTRQIIIDNGIWQEHEPTIITGGFPCQPFSVAGKRKGNEDDRALWPQMLRVISEVKPTYVVAENVAGLLSIENGLVFERVLLDLESEGYEVTPLVIPACATNAPHRRDRVWIVAKSNENRAMVQRRNTSNNNGERYATPQIQKRENIVIGTELASGEIANVTDANEVRLSRSETVGELGGERLTRNAQSRCGITANTARIHAQGFNDKSEQVEHWGSGQWSNWYEAATALCRMDDGVSGELYIIRGIENDESSNTKSKSTVSLATWRAMRFMWEQREVAASSPELYFDRLYNSVQSLPRESRPRTWFSSHETNEEVCNLWSRFYAKSYEEAQDLQSELLIYYRQIERRKAMGSKGQIDRLKSLGNSIVPQIAYEIFCAINYAHSQITHAVK